MTGWLGPYGNPRTSSREVQDAVLRVLPRGDPVGIAELERLMKLGSRRYPRCAVSRALRLLVEAGTVEREGRGSGVRYCLPLRHDPSGCNQMFIRRFPPGRIGPTGIREGEP